MTATIYLVRHGETDDNAAGVPQGLRDVPLNARGRAQAEAVAQWFDGRSIAAVVSSPLSRTLDVARLIGAAHDLEVERDPRLVEFDQGDLDGMPIADVRERYPEFIEQWRTEDPTDLRMPGGETYGEVQRRMVAAIEEAAGRHADQSVVLVTHNLAIKSALVHAMGAPLTAFRRIRTDLAAISILQVNPGKWWRVSLMNEQCHLPGDEATAQASAS